MSKRSAITRVPTGIRNLDELLHGGLPANSVSIVAGPPGAGKTILAQQIAFRNATADAPAVHFSTLSEPTAKTLRYLSQFDFFDLKQVHAGIEFVDLGTIARAKGLEPAGKLVMDHVRRIRPAIVVIDSFRAFDDLAQSHEELRKFGYEMAIQLMAWETTSLLLGEYGMHDVQTNPVFSVVDGLILLSQRQEAGEQQRFLQVVKMRGTDHDRDEQSFRISSSGIAVYSPRVTIRRNNLGSEGARLQTGISRLDELLGEGIPRGASVLVAGVAGTGKTVMLLEFIYRGALAGEKGIIFSFEETEARLRAAARGLGWDLDAQIERGVVEVVFIPQPEIRVEEHLLMMHERVTALGARRVVVDSASVFLHKTKDPQITREKVFQLASVVQNAQAVGLFATDIAYGSGQISRWGVEETVVDGVILLTSSEVGMNRERYLEIYKMRNTAHLQGRHAMVIGPGGITVYPRYAEHLPPAEAPAKTDGREKRGGRKAKR